MVPDGRIGLFKGRHFDREIIVLVCVGSRPVGLWTVCVFERAEVSE
jgi:hypothetical protein